MSLEEMSLEGKAYFERFKVNDKTTPAFQFPALDPQKDVLVIIDMQPFFSGAKKPETLAACQDLIRCFMAASCYILLVEYVGYNENEILGTTHPDLTSLLEGYSKIINVKKSQDNGSDNIFEAIRISLCKDPLQMRLTVCGVNIMACIVRTVRGLLVKGFDLILAKNACNDDCYYQWPDFYKEVMNFRYYYNVDKKLKVVNGTEYDLLNAVG